MVGFKFLVDRWRRGAISFLAQEYVGDKVKTGIATTCILVTHKFVLAKNDELSDSTRYDHSIMGFMHNLTNYVF